ETDPGRSGGLLSPPQPLHPSVGLPGRRPGGAFMAVSAASGAWPLDTMQKNQKFCEKSLSLSEEMV
ncbi:MAG TPA: hypothetical protein VN421_08365, partial [Pseudoflavonifractor sp.]|nr:hypothetical protein [Pseudoflavonifractor sp.]